MGTLCACAYATLFFVYFERTYLYDCYKNNRMLYQRMIDDILLVWSYNPLKPDAFESFKLDLERQSKLKWTTEML